ncbi:MAG: ABC transporter permease subunit [Protaetiibacter sp.]
MTRRLRARGVFRGLAWIYGLAFIGFLLLPILIVIPASITPTTVLKFPPDGFSLRWYEALAKQGMWQQSFVLSLQVALLAAVITVVCAVLLGVAHYRYGGVSAWTRVLTMLPLLVPGVVVATGLFAVLLQLDALGDPLVLAIVQSAIAMPVVSAMLLSAFDSLGRSLWFAASSLGARARTIILRLLVPEILVPVVAAFVLAFSTAFDEVTFAVFLGVPTLPSRMFAFMQLQADPVLAAVASVLFFIAVGGTGVSALLMGARRAQRRRRALLAAGSASS